MNENMLMSVYWGGAAAGLLVSGFLSLLVSWELFVGGTFFACLISAGISVYNYKQWRK